MAKEQAGRSAAEKARRRMWIAGGLLAALLSVPMLNYFTHHLPPLPVNAVEGKTPGFVAAASILQAKCADCHTQATQLPFYGKWPIVRGIIAEDVEEGLEHFPMETLLYRPGAPDQVSLAKLEHTLAEGDMPPGKYLLAHWEARLAEDDKRQLLAWIGAERRRHFASPNVHPKLRAEVLQPVPPVPVLSPAKVALGRKLFHDTRLSGDDTLSCASCHSLQLGGTDRVRYSRGIRGKVGGINSPTVFNASLNVLQFWDGRAANLAEQAKGPVANPDEMGADWSRVVAKLQNDAEYARNFQEVYAAAVSQANVVDAIAAFEQTLLTPDSPFDRYLQSNDKRHLSKAALEGYALFKEEGCATCHVGAGVGGRSFEKFGVKNDYFAERGGAKTDADLGRFHVTKQHDDRHRFKVPTLRNVALTAPYFHDGSVHDLRKAVGTMGRVQLGKKLSDHQIGALVAFLESLTGTYQGQVLRASTH